MAVLDDYLGFAEEEIDWSALDGRAELGFFRDHCGDDDAVVERLAPFQGVVLMRERTPMPASVLDRLPGLELVITTGSANPSLDVTHATKLGKFVCATLGRDTGPVELTWALTLALTRNLLAEDATVRAGGWGAAIGTRLHGATLGLLGLGRLGTQVARSGRDAFGMDVVAWTPALTRERAAECGATLVPRDELFARSDVLSIHARSSLGDPPVLGERELALMKPTAYLVNTARGRLVDENALLRALEDGRIAGAGLDVYQTEPLPPEHPLRRAPHTVLTPHIAHVTRQRHGDSYSAAVVRISDYLDGTPSGAITP